MEKVTSNIKIPDNLDVLKKHFSHCFNKEGSFDFEKFKVEISKNNEINFSKESFGLDWLGKSYARLLASDSTKTLLKEDIEFNKQEKNKNSENLLIKGDNLEVLKHLSNAYHEQIKMIYIDPPYNTGTDGFVYEDDRKFNIDEFSQLAGVDKEKAKRILDFVDSKSNSHSAWLTFMYPRLYIAKQLLKDDGVIFISVDDNEVAQLRLLMDEIFGEENFVSEIINIVKTEGRRYGSFAKTHEYIICYTKNNSELNKLVREDEFKYEDKYSKYRLTDLRNQNSKAFNITNRPNLYYPFYVDISECDKYNCFRVSTEKTDKYCLEVFPIEVDSIKSVWRWGKDKSNKNQELDLVARKGNDDIYRIFQKYRSNTTMPKTVWHEKDLLTIKGTKEVQSLFNGKTLFDFPKPISLIQKLIVIGTNEEDTILDFFAGSGTTADAVMQLNANDEGNRKFILAQLPEEIDKKKSKVAYDFVKDELEIDKPTIFEITKERIVRASNKIKEENKDKKDLDLGFKIFETIPIWEDYNIEAEEFSPQLKLFDETKLNEEDLKTLLVTWKTYDNVPLTQDLKEIDLDGYKGYYFEKNLYLMNKGFETKHLKKILEEIDKNDNFSPSNIIVFGYHFQSKNLREIAENVKSYVNKKKSDIEFIVRY